MAGRLSNQGKRVAMMVFAFVLMGYLGLGLAGQADALALGERSLLIDSSDANADTQHTFTFTYATSSTSVGSVAFEYCTSPLPAIACSAPAGIDASGATLTQQTGTNGFVVLSSQASRIVLSRAPSVPVTAGSSQYVFDNVINPDGTPSTFYVRITTYPTIDATGPETDFGAVVNAITSGIDITTEVPPILNFCVGVSIPGDCSTAEGNLIDLGTLKTADVSIGTSQMTAATNALFGLAIAVYGTTMTSGNNVLTPLASPTPSAPGNSQFGLNLRANSTPGIGQDPQGAGSAVPTASYDIPNRFTFNSGDVVAISSSPTDTRKFTASYIVNISPTQPPGVYTATLTYICSATF
ncbi:MAG TPA: hypothetical protein VFM05_12035 [Candidatus Saccharimonadales bacterium]|nr:hypothetical protein [Candidatus Saccharimonadales bacterium]